MLRLVAFVAIALAAGAADARAADFRVVVVPGLELSDLQRLQTRGAVGLLSPGAGRRTSERLAEASLVRGEVSNSARGASSGQVLLSFTRGAVPRSGPVIVLGLPPARETANDRRYPIAVLGRGYNGLLTSASTRIPGLVSIDDVAPTALGRGGALGWEPEADAATAVRALDAKIRAHRRAKVPAALLAVALTAMLALVFPRAGLLGFGAALTANLVLGAAGATSLWVVLPAIGLAVAGGAPAVAWAARTASALGLVLAGVIAAYLVGFAIDEAWVTFSPLGPGQNGRYYGLTNLLETLLLVPALAGAALLGKRFGGAAFAAVAGLALLTVAGSRFGADGGGAIVLAVGFAVLAVGLAQARRRALAIALPAAAALVLGFVAIDAATGASSHVTDALGDGPGGLARDVGDRVALAWANATATWWTVVCVVAALAGLVALAVRAFRRDGLGSRDRALLLAFLAALGTSLVVNDSPLDEAVVGFVGFLSVLRFAETEATAGTPG